ncbi:MAG TPA: 3'-5' exonuclease [Candidatus Competibacteraceae bacterium]|nr:3'-5' exonuclease [Candidatus Competibacteraceae bacterium]
MNVLVFDIETVPDVASGRRLYGLSGLDDAQVAEIMFHKRRQEAGHEFLRPHLQRIVTIAVAMRRGESFKLAALGEPGADEAELVRQFFQILDKSTPTLVSWNGGGFDLPVLHYRALLHGIQAPRYWETGEEDPAFRYNNYLSRFHWRHVDLMDVLSGYQARAVAPLDEIATLLGLPGKMGMHGSKVWQSFQAGEIGPIRDYCETDVLNTYLVWLRFELMRGQLTADGYARECQLLRRYLAEQHKPHLDAFLEAWSAGGRHG